MKAMALLHWNGLPSCNWLWAWSNKIYISNIDMAKGLKSVDTDGATAKHS